MVFSSGKRCPKCNVEISNEKYLLLEVRCMVGLCPVKEITKEKGCPFCNAPYILFIKHGTIDSL